MYFHPILKLTSQNILPHVIFIFRVNAFSPWPSVGEDVMLACDFCDIYEGYLYNILILFHRRLHIVTIFFIVRNIRALGIQI